MRFRRTWAAIAAPLLVALALPVLRSEGAGPYSFPHRPHLRAETLEAAMAARQGPPKPGEAAGGKADADCRVCHDYARGPEVHLEGCETCHQSGAALKVVRFVPPPAMGRRPFPHREHLSDGSLTCFSCHRPLLDNDWVEFAVPPPGLIAATGPGTGSAAKGLKGSKGPACADCHAPHEPASKAIPQYAKTGDGKGCAPCHGESSSILPLSQRPGAAPAAPAAAKAERPFLHGDHGGSGSKCVECHAPVEEAKSLRGYDAAAATAKACATCHVSDAAGKSLAAVGNPPRTSTVPFHSVEGFNHPAHLHPAGKVTVSAKPGAGCRSCHFPSTDPAAPEALRKVQTGAEPAGREELASYAQCVSCHEGWKVEGHGVGRWACFKCHAPAEDRPGHLPLGTAKVERPRVASVALAVHPHPGITTWGPVLATPREAGGKDCRECHLGKIPALASRLAGRPFSHGPHLPPQPKNADCLRCHAGAATSTWSEDLGTFDPKSCAACHTGIRPGDLVIEPTRREVRQFDHAAHVVAGRRSPEFQGLACSECHDAGGASGYQVRPDAADCSRCHSHDPARGPEKVARTGPKGREGGETARCLTCHGSGAGAAPALLSDAGPAHASETRIHLDLLPGRQWHDLGAPPGDAGGGCAACHDRDSLAGMPAEYRERITEARVLKPIHEDPALKKAWFNKSALQKKDGSGDPEGKGRTCWTCHRQDPRGYLRELGGR